MMKVFRNLWLVLLAGLNVALAAEYPTQFSNQDSITNTRHNMTQSSVAGLAGAMVTVRNNYGEVCVYCHTPHGANTAAAAPLWNRTLPVTTVYTTYDKLNTSSLTQTVYQPGAASLPCLSCHDGSQAIDAIINMPGAGQYFATPDPTKWVVWSAATGQTKSTQHRTLIQCMACHTDNTGSEVATDFTAFVIGTDLRNDHPIGVTFPTSSGVGTDWNTPGGTKAVSALTNKFFDETPNGRMDKNEIRLYDSGNGASVECASCHDPHGVPSGAAGSTFNPTFLRKTNVASAVCLTCHAK